VSGGAEAAWPWSLSSRPTNSSMIVDMFCMRSLLPTRTRLLLLS